MLREAIGNAEKGVAAHLTILGLVAGNALTGCEQRRKNIKGKLTFFFSRGSGVE